MRLCESLRQPMEESVKLAGVQLREAIALGRRETAAGQDDAVVRIAADDEPSRAIDNRRLGGVVKGRQELGEVVPAAVPWRPNRMPDAVFERQLLADLPTVLNEPVEGRGNPGSDGLPAQFRVVVEIPEQRVAQRQAGSQGIAGVQE